MKYANGETVDVGDVVALTTRAKVVAVGTEGDKGRVILSLVPEGQPSVTMVYADQVNCIEDVKAVEQPKASVKHPALVLPTLTAPPKPVSTVTAPKGTGVPVTGTTEVKK